MATELLAGADVGSAFQELGRERVRKGVSGDAFGDPGLGGRLADGAADHRWHAPNKRVQPENESKRP